MVLNRIFSLSVFAIVLFFGSNSFVYGQKSGMENKSEDLAAMPLENVQIEAQSIEQLFTELSLLYDIPIGLEIASNDNELATYNISFKNGVLPELLDQIVGKDNEYEWVIKDGVVNIFPKTRYRDAVFEELLETKISTFLVTKKTNCWTLVESLVAKPEIQGILRANSLAFRRRGFSGTYIPTLGQDFTLFASDTSIRSILNSVAKKSPLAKIWFIRKTNNDSRTFFISFSSRHEAFPWKKGEPAFPKIDF